MHETDNLFLQPIPSPKISAGLRLRQCKLFNSCICNTNVLHFLHWQYTFFFIFGTRNANLFYFRHWKCIFFLVFGIGNANFFYFLPLECKFFLFFAKKGLKISKFSISLGYRRLKYTYAYI